MKMVDAMAVLEQQEYEGRTYFLRNGKWTGSDSFVASEEMQKILNKRYADTLDLTAMDVDTLLWHGDQFKQSSSYHLAIRFFSYAVDLADEQTLSYILPRLTSCYRKNGLPQKAIDLLTYASRKFGRHIISSALLVSAAAAYCDMKDYEHARQCCNRAYAASNGETSAELRAVYGRIQKESQ